MATAADGWFVVVFHRTRPGNPQPGDIFGRLFSPQGLPASGEFQINSQTDGGQLTPRIANSPDGQFLIVWYSDTSSGSDQSSRSIQSRWLSPAGLPIGSDRQVNSFTFGEQRQPALAFDASGGYLVSWERVRLYFRAPRVCGARSRRIQCGSTGETRRDRANLPSELAR